MGRKPSFLDSSLRIDGILDTVRIAQKKPQFFGHMIDKSQIKFKASFLKYLHYCVDMELLKKTPKTLQMPIGRYSFIGKQHFVFYSITVKGNRLLGMLG